MRVLQVNKFFFEKGGTERYFFSLSRALERRGHTVHHLSMHHPDNLPSPDSRYFVAERDYDAGGSSLASVATSFAFIRSREAAAKLDTLLRDTQPQVAHLHNIYHQITPSILPVLRRARVATVMTLHDYKLICPNYSLFDGRHYCFRCRGGRFYRAPLARCRSGSAARSALLAVEAYWQKATRVYDSVQFFLAPSRYIRSKFVEEGFGEERVVYLPAFIEAAAPQDPPPADPPPPLPGRYVLYFGRLSREKGLGTLLAAIRTLPDVPLVLCGDGPLQDELKRYSSQHALGHVRFTGRLTHGALDRVIEGAHAVILPTESPENAPFTVLESMAHGVPVIVSDIGGLPELAEKTGAMTFPPGDVGALASCIRDVWGDGERARTIGREGRRVIEEEFTVENHTARLEDIYRQAVKRLN